MLSVIAVATSCLGLSPALAVTIVDDGKTDYVIALRSDPIPSEQTAANELQHYLELISGARLAIVSEADVEEGVKLVSVGAGDLFSRLVREPHAPAPPGGFARVDGDALGRDTIVIETVGDNLYLAGGRPRGTLYAVYTFLEDVLGVRWWSPTEESVPQTPTITLGNIDSVQTPKLRVREAFYRNAFDGQFAPKLKLNGHFERITEEYGGHYSIIGWCHTFYPFLPPETYFEAHPEWYSEINGERRHQGGQLCLTNDEMRAEMVKVALERLRQDPGAGMISISQNDWYGRCECRKCKAVEEAEGSPSGLLIQFVNQVAEEIGKEFPDTLVETLAYQYTRKAPNTIKPRDNVVVRLCSSDCNRAEPLETGPANAEFKADIEAWSKIAGKLYIWDYVTNFVNLILPHPNHRVLVPNLRFFVDHNTIGLFEQGDAYSSCSDFPELRTWVLAHLMWDPSLDERAVTEEFLRGYYGAAGDPLMQYIDLIDDAVEGTHLRCSMKDTSAWLGLSMLNDATVIFDEAEKAVEGDEVLRKRVARARMPLDHVWLNRYAALRRSARAQGLECLGPADPRAAAEAFVARAKSLDMGSYRLGRAFSEYAPVLLDKFGDPAKPPAEVEGLAEDDWVDIQHGEFRLAGRGSWVTVVDDETASDGKAVRMGGGHANWAVQLPVSQELRDLGRVRCYVAARCEPKADAGVGFTLGIYDGEGGRGVAQAEQQLEDATPEYRTYDLGVHELGEPWYFWAAPPGDAERVEAVYIDRIFLVKEAAE